MPPPQYRTPAQLIESHLQARGWTQRVLAKILDLPETTVSNIMNGKKPITTGVALHLHAVLGIDVEELLRLQTAYELAKAQLEFRIDPSLSTRIAVFGDLPVTDMIQRGWLKGVTDIRHPHLEVALCDFFGVDSVDQIEILPHSAKKTNVNANVTPAQLAWLYRVRQLAVALPAARFSQAALLNAIAKLRTLLISPDAARKVPKIMMECGVRYVIVESLPSAKIDGVCFWADDNSPVIGMSLRYDRIDNFWFVLRHEIEHVFRGHGKSAMVLDIELEKERAGTGQSVSEEERLANEAAANFCVPRPKLENFIARKSPMFSERDIRGFAATLQVHPGLIAGQLQHETGRYDLFRNHLVKIRSIVTPNAYVDGWGDVAPVEI
jgi:HTH-type transcriptional regulator / antitoxin HigA